MKSRVLNLLISLDQFAFSIITLGKAPPDETMSAAAYRLEQEGKWQGKLFRPIIDKLFFWDELHCRSSFESELDSKHLSAIYRNGKEEDWTQEGQQE